MLLSNIPGLQIIGNTQRYLKPEGLAYSQKVEISGKRMTITVYFEKDSSASVEDAKKVINASISKISLLAQKLELGKNDLEKISINHSTVIGTWKRDNIIAEENFLEKLNSDLRSLQHRPEEKKFIREKIVTIEKTSHFFSKSIYSPGKHKKNSSKTNVCSRKPMHVDISNDIFDINSKIESRVRKSFYPANFNEDLTTFNSKLKDAKRLAHSLESTQNAKLIHFLKLIHDKYRQLDEIPQDALPEDSLRILKNIKDDIESLSLQLKTDADRSSKETFKELEESLAEMITSFHKIINAGKRLDAKGDFANGIDKEQLELIEADMRAKITEYNALVGNAHLSTNAMTAVHSHAMALSAVVEKKRQLMQREAELKSHVSLHKGEKKELRNIKKSLHKAPTVIQFTTAYSRINNGLTSHKNQKLVPINKARQLNQAHPELTWGSSHLSSALITPANWPVIRTALIKESKSGKVHVCVTKITPLNITEKGGVPASLRSKDSYRVRATNLLKTTSYILSNDEKVGKHVSFRGGQFPTVYAALEALRSIQENLPEGEKLESLHINAVLTPTALTFIKEDRTLLAAHKRNILDAIDILIKEAYESGYADERINSLLTLRKNVSISNFGVNEGAVGESQIIVRIKLGWHHSIKEYSNDAAKKLNAALSRKVQYLEHSVNTESFSNLSSAHLNDLDNLGAILYVGLEMEAIWANNDYADARKDHNQFKLPALWKTMDALLGIVSYIDCMSGKDRTGKVEGCAQEYIDEIRMNITDHKQELLKCYFKNANRLSRNTQEVWKEYRSILTTACFHKNELDDLANRLAIQGEAAFREKLKETVTLKVAQTKLYLGGNHGLLVEKRRIPAGFLHLGTHRIPKNTPKINTFEGQELPNVAVSSIYRRPRINQPSTDKKLLENRQREAVNRRLSQLTGSLQVTQMNTSRSGFKLKHGEPLARHSSGFDRNYVLWKLSTSHEIQPSWLGLQELDDETAYVYLLQLNAVKNKKMTSRSKLKAWTAIIKKIEYDKMQSLYPKGKVKT